MAEAIPSKTDQALSGKIGDRIGVSEGTVKATLQELFRKTGVRTRSQLVRVAPERAPHQARL